MAKAASTRASKKLAATTERPEVDVREYNKVVDSAELQTVQALKVALIVEPEYYDDTKQKKFHFDRGQIGATFDPDACAVAGRFMFAVTVKQGRSRVLKASAEYMVIYSVHEGADVVAAEAFCGRVGIFAAYPYFRSLMAHLSWESNAQLPVMPVIATRGSKVRAVNIESGSGRTKP